MAVPTLNFTTGVSTLPDVGILFYNGCKFSPLFKTSIRGIAIKDEAGRTVKYVEYIIEVDGYVTLADGATDINSTVTNLRRRLQAQGGNLIYQGRGFDLDVNDNSGSSSTQDVAWGPVPELLEFQPLGGGLSAKIQWRVTTRIPESSKGITTGGGRPRIILLQFNYETDVSYGEDGYSTLAVRGTLEIPLTRTPGQSTRTLTQTADDLRSEIDKRIMAGIDLEAFRMTRRNFSVSRDKRTLTWDYVAEEKAYMDLPEDHTVARGTYSVRPEKAGMGLIKWLCTLRATYTVRRDRPRRTAWLAFLGLLRHRMNMSTFAGNVAIGGNPAPPRPPTKPDDIKNNRNAFLMDFNIDEGLYLDSKTITFSATWRLVCPFDMILLASGIWSKVRETNLEGKNLWAISMRDVQGSHSWQADRVRPELDVIVDFGS